MGRAAGLFSADWQTRSLLKSCRFVPAALLVSMNKYNGASVYLDRGRMAARPRTGCLYNLRLPFAYSMRRARDKLLLLPLERDSM